jgi:lambda family phage portal protein
MSLLERFLPGLVLKLEHERAALARHRELRNQAGARQWDPIWDESPDGPQNRYDGTGRGRRGSRWRTDNPSVATELYRSLPLLVARSRDLWKNNGFARKACGLISTEAVGSGITAALVPGRGAKVAAGRIARWMASPFCDLNGRANFFALQAMVAGQVPRDGAVFIRRHWKREPRTGIALRLEFLGRDWLSTMNDGPTEKGGAVVMGIEYDSHWQRVAYHFYKALTGDVWGLATGETVRVPAADVIHIYRQDEAGQEDGVPWLAPCLWTLRDLQEYEDAQVLRQKLAACLVLKRTSGTGSEQPGELAPDGTVRPRSETFEPGTQVYLKPGDNAEYMTPPGVDGFDVVQKHGLRKVAASMPVSYIALTGDFSGSPYSASRQDHHFMTRSLDQFTWFSLVPHLCDGVLAWLHEAMLLEPGIIGATWTPPRRELLDPSKEVPPMVTMVRAGLKARQEVIRSLGDDPAETDRMIAEDNARADQLNLILDSDPRHRDQAGKALKASADPEDEATPAASAASEPEGQGNGQDQG